jgi:predicted anti-sigma-YlaC factor YlaD
MNCRQASRRLPGYVDGALYTRDRAQLREHLNSCAVCREQLERYRRLARCLANVEAAAPPEDLAMRIRLAAVHARTREPWLRRLVQRAAIISENILEPLALPATGGVLTAIFAFLFVVQGILVGVPVAGANDWPGNLIQPARLESLAPFPVAGIADSGETPDAGLLIVDATLNELGQVVSYSILAGPNDAAVRHQLDQVLLFSRFRPQISFGRPMPGGRVILNFSEVRVRG